jgi:hypothetical protein
METSHETTMRKERIEPLLRCQLPHGSEYRFLLLQGKLRIHAGF